MVRTNEVVEALLQEYADLLSISGGDPFRVRTYEKAARSIGGYHADLSTLDDKGILSISNVGKSIVGKVRQALDTGTFEQLEELRKMVPAGVREMISISMLGPKKALMLYRDLHIASVQELADAINDGRLAGLRGFVGKPMSSKRRTRSMAGEFPGFLGDPFAPALRIARSAARP